MISLLKFAKVHVFPYSKRPNTAAFQFKNHIDSKIIDKRTKTLNELSKKMSYELRENFIGRKMKVLFFQEIKNKLYLYNNEFQYSF